MDFLAAAALGIVQGLTEFLPVSSTGHLILAREFLGLESAHGLALDALLHFATAFAVLWYFWRDFWQLAQSVWMWGSGRGLADSQRTLALALALGTVPAVALGLLLEEAMETTFRSVEFVAWTLLAGSALFLIAEYVGSRLSEKRELSAGRGLLIGLFQALALLPGMSRSGATISGGLLLGLSREGAARFAFLLSLPIILGAGSKKTLELGSAGVLSEQWLTLLVAFFVAFTTGVLAIHFLLRFLREHTLLIFVVYRVALASALLFFI